jgi:hypothetical protein
MKKYLIAATADIGPAMGSSAAKSADARCGVQGTFAVSGINAETPREIGSNYKESKP